MQKTYRLLTKEPPKYYAIRSYGDGVKVKTPCESRTEAIKFNERLNISSIPSYDVYVSNSVEPIKHAP